MADAVRRICELIPGASAVVSAHRASLSEFGNAPEPESGVAPYSFFSEVREFVFSDAEGRDERVTGLFEFLEESLDSPNQMVREGSMIRIAQKLFRYEDVIAASSAAPGPRLREVMDY